MEIDMIRTVGVAAISLGFLLLAGQVSAQDSDAKARSTNEIELLKRENELLKRENALLKKEIEQLKAGDPDKAAKTSTFSDIFVVGAVFTSKAEHIGGPTRGTTASGTFTITSRDGDAFMATNTWVNDDQAKSNGTSEIKGTITSARTAKWKRVDAPIGMETVAKLRQDGSFIDTQGKNAKGLAIRGVMKVGK